MVSEQDPFKRLIDIGIALSAEKNTDKLMEKILLEAKSIGKADGGTLYIRNGNELKFEIVRTDSLGIAQGGTTGEAVTIPPVKMVSDDGNPNEKNVVSYCAITGKSVNIEDAYSSEEFDFSGTKKFDEMTGLRSKSFLNVPLKNNLGEVIGVLQLLNSLDLETGEVVAFSGYISPLIEALASQAAVALDNAILIESQKKLLDSFIELMASAVDAKSPYTGGHCQRVPELTEMLTRAACASNESPFADFDLSEDEWYELHIGAWLHDCGKVTTPEYVVDKATKLETITDRIHEVRVRFEVVKRDVIIKYHERVAAGEDVATAQAEMEQRLAEIDEDFYFVAECNRGAEFFTDEKIERIHKIAGTRWTRTLDNRAGVSDDELKRLERQPITELPVEENLLADRADHIFEHDVIPYAADPENPYGFRMDAPDKKFNKGEVYNLCIQRGTLSDEERFKINDHIVQTIVMLENLPFPKHLERVPEIAGGHHEMMNGNGYPKKLDGSQMSIPARIMAIADVFEALTAADRPYKSPKSLSASIKNHVVHGQRSAFGC
ncbi:MAG: HD domain-containing phosphohydrolase [Pseudomonadales bacterium]|nr:HD domain-containing phosphohydrolase [Pseudomonadales bacterium]